MEATRKKNNMTFQIKYTIQILHPKYSFDK